MTSLRILQPKLSSTSHYLTSFLLYIEKYLINLLYWVGEQVSSVLFAFILQKIL